ncbi:MAG: 3-isopropylmalate dehydrogenase, partial [Chlamydiia bacterium]|nr:3-isopropylmalate dehydrogenase [Chlamydiia bacterium]
GHSFHYLEALVGGAAWDVHGCHFPKETEALARRSDAILFGSVGGPAHERHSPKWERCETESILAVRKTFGFHTNLRPTRVYPSLAEGCVLRPDIVEKSIDMLCVRELSGDIYFGEHCTREVNGQMVATDLMVYDEATIRRVTHAAFQAAMKRNRKVCSVDKANVLDCSRLWRKVVSEVAKEYPECTLEHILVDNCAMQVLTRPFDFDVLLLPNMFGDIISDEVSIFAGSLGMLPSASLNDTGFGLYEPSGGSAPDIAGTGKANPIGQILSAAMMLKYSFDMNAEHAAVVNAVEEALDEGYRTIDIAHGKREICSCSEMGSAIASYIR